MRFPSADLYDSAYVTIFFFALDDEENITESRLAFRGTFDSFQLHYEQDDRRGSRIVWESTSKNPL